MSSVLVVDDVALNRDIAKALLSGYGHYVLEAAGAAEALEIVQAVHPDVVVTDVLMPGMDGYDLVRAIRAHPDTAGIPVVFYTANYLESEARPLAEAFGVTEVVLRTDDPSRLIEAVESALRAGEHTMPRPDLEHFEREHLHTVNNKLISKVHDLHTTEERFRIIADESPVGIMLTDNTATALYISPRVAEILHRSPESLHGSGWLEVYDAETRAAVTAAINGDESIDRHRTLLTGDDGAEIWLDLIVRRVGDVHGKFSGAVIMIDDVTQLVTADDRAREEIALREAEVRQRLTERLDNLARMSGTVAHEFNNILAGSQAYLAFAIDSLTATLADGHRDAATGWAILRDLERSRHSGQRGADLSKQLLAFGRHEIVHPIAVDLTGLITATAVDMAADAPAHIHLKMELAGGRILVQADPLQLSQALRHLVTNAGEAMPDGGTCTIVCTHDADEGIEYAVVTVQDTGVGMPAEAVAQAIDPFYTTKQRGQGTGLGLTTAYGIVAQAGGQLSIESVLGEGTRVRVRLPVTTMAGPPMTDAVSAPPHPGLGSAAFATILVVDDDEDVRTVVGRILTMAGYAVVTATDGAHALIVAKQHQGSFDCLVTDVMMPVMNGHELALQFEEIYPGTPILFISGYAAALINEQGLLDPGSTVVTKPFSREELLAAVQTKLESAVSR